MRFRCLVFVISFLLLSFSSLSYSDQESFPSEPGSLRTVTLDSKILKANKVGLDTKREIKVYLPPNYDKSDKHYPVIYHFHSIFWDNKRMFEDGYVKSQLDRMIHDGIIKPYIFVVGDFSTPQIGPFYGNNKVAGRWLDHIIKELVPFIDNNFRTIPKAESRAATGEFLGAYAAIKLGMLYPDMFSVIYGLHPVATGSGHSTVGNIVDWRLINEAKSWDQFPEYSRESVFITMAQNYLPNPKRPPFYADLMVEVIDDQLIYNTKNIQTIHKEFHLDIMLHDNIDNLNKLKAIGFDWGRFDPTFSHVEGNREFTLMLSNYGIQHFAEEYNGLGWDRNWEENGRVMSSMMPLLEKNLTF